MLLGPGRLGSFALVAIMAAGALGACAQSAETKIYFSGATPYTDSDLTSVVGLHSGQLFTDNELQEGSKRLIATGLFDAATLTAAGQGPARQARYTIRITPLDKLLRPSFENLVWFAPGELDKELRARVPLYRGLLPDSGNFADTVQTAIVDLLKEKGIHAIVFHSIVEPTTQHPVRVVNFEIGNISVRIGDIHVAVSGPAGVSDELAPYLKEAVSHSEGLEFNEGLTGITLEDRILAPVRNAGYIAASLNVVSRTPVKADDGYTIACDLRIETGDPYSISALDWIPTPIYSADEFHRVSTLNPGELARYDELTSTESAITLSYRKLGYMDMYLRVVPTLDASAHTVAYTLSAVPGEPYRLNSISTIGLDAPSQQTFDNNFAIKHGDPYSEPYVSNFLHNNPALGQLDGLIATFQATADPNTHLVDLVITFVPNVPNSPAQ